ncbi:FtsX-like permease family protein [Oleiharenicola lentus]|uniref:FtsX-like permease family protein n=1 Tax=Oleiharenicola lentus TaxID=2508720 RepID=UPI003F67D30B
MGIGFSTLDRMVEESYAQDRFALLLVTLFGGLGLVLSAIGLYGLLSFQVVRRTREIGALAALGAQQADILKLILREGGRRVCLGIAVGCASAFAVTRLLQSQLHEVSNHDPAAYLLTIVTFAIVAGLACCLPARRAARVDPMIALRAE